ncbi:DinB family protein [Marinomonas mediterranea]|jgi:Uncharacterized protein conserved in bacteria|uniref:DinB family protein n=1 Tax=Marinomonas mediterranea (strain ATCC 700492 / JCM 21426 / NBRC 103028 / MMB-1) TaxID=717774 RepID=F2JX53_MARM1|nr:DinB family protein [Marinomonas mediterranea]ADZ89572.1 DinB family protein [Marinomonas mediterranea MMB-1]WCN07666.1 damage-inducible protein DinB [Marinomonas mediterranea]WCN11767.1 damage-inducible protein DinB [Marinomonas mediterranea]WCN15815.1 damage-inducible protein DinB [Marinomonas mediterranea MMB-1]
MISQEYCQRLSRYNALINEQLFAACAQLPDKERKADCQLYFKSIHSTLNHILYGDIAWISRFIGDDSKIPELGRELYGDYDALRDARFRWDREIKKWSDQIDEAWLAGEFSFISKVDNLKRSKPAWLLVTHMFNHSTHHRGQITSILSQRGIDYGTMDIHLLL